MVGVRQRIIISLILISLLATLTAGGFSIAYIRDRTTQSTFSLLAESAQVYGKEMDTVIVGMEATVDALNRSILGIIDPERIQDPAYYRELSEELEGIAAQFDRNTVGAMSVYVRFDPRISYSTAGFFHADTDGDGVLERLTPTDLSAFDPSDREHVGWFYEPMVAGKPIWMNPYYNANINIEMLSYIAPIFVENKAIGVVGVDINFARLKDIVARQPEVGKAILMNSDYQFLVHDIFKPTDSLSMIDDGRLRPLQEILEGTEHGTAEYQLFGVDKVLGFSRLRNGWTVVVALTKEEAFASLNNTLWMLMGMNLFITAAMVAISLLLGRYLSNIIQKNSQLEQEVAERTQQLVQTNEYLENSMAEMEAQQAELTMLNGQLEESLMRLQETQEQLLVSEKLASLGELVAGVAHEINTPLGIGVTLNSYLEKQVRELGDLASRAPVTQEAVQEFLESATEATELSVRNLNRAAEIVETFKQVAVDQANLELRKIKLCDYVGKVMMNLHPKLKGTAHTVEIDCDETLEIITYPGALAQVLTNLVMNSLIHGFEGIEKGTIKIRMGRRDSMIELVYADDGIGIPPSLLDKVFNPFFSTKRNKGCSGLGLHIVHNLVTQTLEGTIRIRSTPGHGMSCQICIPEVRVETLLESEVE